MLQLLKRCRPSPPRHVDPASPLDRMISLWLAWAKAENATAIVLGMPHQLPASVGEQDNEDEFKRELTQRPDAPAPDIASKHSAALTANSRLKSVAGWRSVPAWTEHDGKLYPMHGPPIEAYLALTNLLQERLVSLDASEESPKPMRYIEYDSDDPLRRCFAEVELILHEDNTIRISILGHRSEPNSVRAVASVD